MKLSFLACLLATFGASAPVTAVEPQHKVAQVAEQTPVVVLGGGVGALTSALYLSRAGLQPIVIEGPQPGGLITQSHAVQNWPGEFEITGHELAEKVRKQAEMNGVRFYRETVTKVDFSKRPFQITTRSLDDETERTLQVESVVIAMGTKPNHLGVPGETGLDGYWGRGVTNCAICDGNLYRDAVVGVVGGGDAAVLEGLYLSNIAKQVNLFVRKDSFKGVEGKRLEALLSKSNVKVFFDTTVEEIKGDGAKVTSVALKTKNKELQNLPLDGLFLAIGSTPNTQIFKGALDLDPQGYISLKKDQETSVAGVYAIGDIVDPVFKQAISAAGDGAKAALQMQQYLSDRASDLIAKQNIPAKPVVLAAKHEVIEITSVEQFERELQSSDVPIFVDFYANWCGPCRQISPRIEKSAEHLVGKVKFLKVNVDRVSRLPGRYEVRAMPTVLLFEPNGQVVDRKVGTDQISLLLKKLEKPAE